MLIHQPGGVEVRRCPQRAGLKERTHLLATDCVSRVNAEGAFPATGQYGGKVLPYDLVRSQNCCISGLSETGATSCDSTGVASAITIPAAIRIRFILLPSFGESLNRNSGIIK